MDERARSAARALPDGGVRVAEAVDRDAAAEIEIFAAVIVPRVPALAAREGQSPVGRGHDILVVKRLISVRAGGATGAAEARVSEIILLVSNRLTVASKRKVPCDRSHGTRDFRLLVRRQVQKKASLLSAGPVAGAPVTVAIMTLDPDRAGIRRVIVITADPDPRAAVPFAMRANPNGAAIRRSPGALDHHGRRTEAGRPPGYRYREPRQCQCWRAGQRSQPPPGPLCEEYFIFMLFLGL